MNDIIDLHTHTIASGHAYNTLYEMVNTAAARGVKLFGSTDHAPSLPGACHPFYFINFKVIPDELFGVQVLMGCELNIIDYQGHTDLEKRYRKDLDYTIASIHEPCYKRGTVKENTSAYLGAIKDPEVTIIGHPDDARFPVEYEPIVAAAAQYHKLLEINSSSMHPRSPRSAHARENYIEMLELCRRYRVSVIVSSDAHIEADVGNHKNALEILEEVNFPEDLVVNTSIQKAAAYIPKLSASPAEAK